MRGVLSCQTKGVQWVESSQYQGRYVLETREMGIDGFDEWANWPAGGKQPGVQEDGGAWIGCLGGLVIWGGVGFRSLGD